MKWLNMKRKLWVEKSWIVCLFLGREACIGYRAEKNKKKLEENQKKQKKQKTKVWGEMLYPKISSRGLVFLVFLEGNGYRAEKNQKNSKKTKKTKKNKKTKVWGEMLYPKISSRGLLFLVFLVILVFFDIFLLLRS